MTDKELVVELQKELTALKKQIEYMEMEIRVLRAQARTQRPWVWLWEIHTNQKQSVHLFGADTATITGNQKALTEVSAVLVVEEKTMHQEEIGSMLLVLYWKSDFLSHISSCSDQ